MNTNNKYNEIKKLCSRELSEIENIMLAPIDVRKELKLHVIKFLTSPSKRIRPMLSLLFMKAAGYDIKNEHLKILSAVELIHNASLIHDDIIDESNFRRGEKTLSYEFGNKLGVICGDYLLSVAMNLLCEINSVEIIKQFTTTLQNMCLGEINQHFNRYKIGTIEDYIEKSKKKTAYLFETALIAPFIYEKSDIILIASEFGLNFGIAFQIKDDIKNLTSKENSKPLKNDIEEGIYTAPVIYAQSAENYLNGVEKAGCLLNNYVSKAENLIENFENNIYTSALRELLELLKYE